jgi:hypothetical protein
VTGVCVGLTGVDELETTLVLPTLCEEEVSIGTVELEAGALPEGTELEAGWLEAGTLEGARGVLEAVDD